MAPKKSKNIKPKKKTTATKKKAIPPKKRKKKKKTGEHYVDSKDFYERIKLYYQTDVIPDELSLMLSRIATGLSYAPNFINYSYREDMIGDAILKMFSALKFKKFNLETGSNPFSYFTTIAYHAFINRIKKENKQHETIRKYQETVYYQEMQDTAGGHVYLDQNTNPDNE